MKIHSPGDGNPKNFTQMISLVVGTLLFVLGLSGMLFSGFAGLHIGIIYAALIATSGVILLYNGYKNNSHDAFIVCTIFAVFFGLHALAGWIFGSPGIPDVGYEMHDNYWLVIIPKIHELGKVDHILNTILALVLAGGAIDWKRREKTLGHTRYNESDSYTPNFHTQRNKKVEIM